MIGRKTYNRIFFNLAWIFCFVSTSGCGYQIINPTVIPTEILTNTPHPTNTKQNTSIPKTKTPSYVPTTSLDELNAIMIDKECRAVIDGLNNLKRDLTIPDHFMEGDTTKKEGDFNPNKYFNVLNHLSIKKGYTLDYFFFGDDLGGKPLLYSRKANAMPYKNYEEFLESYGEETSGERSYSSLGHAYDYLEQVQIDKTPESYFQYVILALLGDQFYLYWHGLYNDLKVICDESDFKAVRTEIELFDLEFPTEIETKMKEIDYSPGILIDEGIVTVRFVTFTKWGGVLESVFKMDSRNPFQVIDVQYNPLIEYDCGISF